MQDYWKLTIDLNLDLSNQNNTISENWDRHVSYSEAQCVIGISACRACTVFFIFWLDPLLHRSSMDGLLFLPIADPAMTDKNFSR
jgi:hypothetical protein